MLISLAQRTVAAVDIIKRDRLVEELKKQSPPPVVEIEKFFDGNDDVGSIGCNLTDHPGMELFKTTLFTLKNRGDVDAIYARIAEVDPGPGTWPFTDTIFVAGKIELEDLRKLLEPLQPDEVGYGKHFDVPQALAQKHNDAVLAAWWD